MEMFLLCLRERLDDILCPKFSDGASLELVSNWASSDGLTL